MPPEDDEPVVPPEPTFCDPEGPAADVVDAGTGWHLLADAATLATHSGLTWEYGPVVKHGAVLETQYPAEYHPTQRHDDGSRVSKLASYLTVLWNDEREVFQMWYEAYWEHGTAYAESEDGILWERIDGLGPGNNIVKPNAAGMSVSIDPTRPWGAPDKYIAAYLVNRDLPEDERDLGGAALAFSSDGIHWEEYNDGFPVTHRAADTQNQVLWDPISGHYRLWTRTDMAGDVEYGEWRGARVMRHKTGDLLAHPTAWTVERDGIVVSDPANPTTVHGVPSRQFHAITMSTYEDVYFHTLDVWTVQEDEPELLEIYLGVSRDGKCFDQTFVRRGLPLIEAGSPGSLDDEGAKPASRIIEHGGQHWVYYTGVSSQAPGRTVALATVPERRLIGAQAGTTGGVLTTRPLSAPGSSLVLDVAAGAGELVVELLDEAGDPLEGYAGVDAARYYDVDSQLLQVSWSGDGLPVGVRPIRLRITLEDATLFGFRVGD